MRKNEDENIKIKIKYSEDTLAWNNFINNIICFLVDNDLFGDTVKDGKNEQ